MYYPKLAGQHDRHVHVRSLTGHVLISSWTDIGRGRPVTYNMIDFCIFGNGGRSCSKMVWLDLS